MSEIFRPMDLTELRLNNLAKFYHSRERNSQMKKYSLPPSNHSKNKKYMMMEKLDKSFTEVKHKVPTGRSRPEISILAKIWNISILEEKWSFDQNFSCISKNRACAEEFDFWPTCQNLDLTRMLDKRVVKFRDFAQIIKFWSPDQDFRLKLKFWLSFGFLVKIEFLVKKSSGLQGRALIRTGHRTGQKSFFCKSESFISFNSLGL